MDPVAGGLVGVLIVWACLYGALDASREKKRHIHIDDWHDECESDDCASIVCFKPNDPACPGYDAEPGCLCGEGRVLCLDHLGECARCVQMIRTDARW